MTMTFDDQTSARASVNRVLYVALLLVATVQMAYTGYWIALEVCGRLGFWPGALTNFDLNAFLATESLLNQVTFASFAVLFITTYILILLRRAAAFWVLMLAFAIGRLDWILLALNDHFTNFLGGMVDFFLQACMLILCVALRLRGVLR